MRIFKQVRETVAALDEAMPEIEDSRRDYGPEGCAKRGAFLGLVVAAVVAVVLLAGCKDTTGGRPTPAPVASCEEDQPCWDCSKHGNRVCGPEDVRR